MTAQGSRRIRSAAALAAFVVAGAGFGLQAAEVEGVRLWAGPENTRVVLDISRPAEHRVFTLTSPDRVVVDLIGSSFAHEGSLPSGEGVVEDIRTGRHPNGNLRIVLDVSHNVQPRSFLATPNEIYGHRLVIDLATNAIAAEPLKVAPAPSGAGRDVVVAIDAGHGGEDPGAVGRGGTYEKTVVLAIARRLQALIDREVGMRAVLLRAGDYSISHRGRIALARRQAADLFVSIHADAFRDARARGSSVYVLSERGASSEAARWLAERENRADLIGGVSLGDKDDVLASVLLDLSQTAAISASMKAAADVLEELSVVGRVHKHEVQHANFLVLKSPDIPSILVETAFISNPDEERKLADAAFQKKWAKALLSGVRAYFEAHAPPDTLIAARATRQQAPREYVIARGDTLANIAQRYDVSVSTLRRMNGLSSDRIQTGQVLAIPLVN